MIEWFSLFSSVTLQESSSSSSSESDNENDLILRKNQSKISPVKITVQPVVIQSETIRKEDLIKNEIDAIVTSCLTKKNREVKRKIKLGKRTAADDQEYEDEDKYLTHSKRHGQASR